MAQTRPPFGSGGFTLVELLLAMALGALVALVLGLLVQGLFTAGGSQTERLQGPVAARRVLLEVSRDLAVAFAPPDPDITPLQIVTSFEPGQPEVQVIGYVPVAAGSPLPLGYDIHRIAYEVHRVGDNRRELRRIRAPVSGPYADLPATNVLLRGRFEMELAPVVDGEVYDEWPPPGRTEPPALPPSIRISLTWDGQAPMVTETLIQAATGVRSSVERPGVDAEPGE